MRVPVNKIENLDIHANYSKLVLRHSLEKIKMSYSIRCLHTDCGFAKRRHKHVRVCILIAHLPVLQCGSNLSKGYENTVSYMCIHKIHKSIYSVCVFISKRCIFALPSIVCMYVYNFILILIRKLYVSISCHNFMTLLRNRITVNEVVCSIFTTL